MKIEQRIGRIDRIGQEKNVINIVNFIVDGSIDERVMNVVQKKLSLISSSVFAVRKMMEQDKESTMYDEKSLARELKASDQLVNALEYSNQFPQADYDLLDYTDTSFCNPQKLARTAKQAPRSLPWLKKNRITDSWTQRVKNDTKEVMDWISFYE